MEPEKSQEWTASPEGVTNGTAEKATGLTVQQMFDIYPAREAERVIVDQNYLGGREKAIQSLKELLEQGINAETCAEGIKKLEENTPCQRPIDPDEPAGLDPEVLWRIIMLKYTYRDGYEHAPRQLDNLNGILDAYRNGNLKVVEGEVTVWFAGHKTMGPLPSDELQAEDYIKMVPKWQEEFGPGGVWVEKPTRKSHARVSMAALPPGNDSWHHTYSIRARLIGATSFIVLDNILDDTGSDCLELFGDDDCVSLV